MSRTSWFDDESQKPQIDQYARKMSSFIEVLADGQVEAQELQQQETRLIALMKEVEPLLDDALHAKVTQLLCELTAYDLMQVLHEMQHARPKTAFRG